MKILLIIFAFIIGCVVGFATSAVLSAASTADRINEKLLEQKNDKNEY
jgi:H+/Cl- antiporter ClcA